MAIKMLTGLPGQGKTYVLAQIAYNALYEGRDVYANFRLGYPEESKSQNLHYWRDPKDLVGIENGVIVMDEAHVYFNSRLWAEFPIELQYKFQQHRKDGLDIWGTVQNEARLDVVIRELVTSFYQCVKMFGSGEGASTPWGLIRVAQYAPEDIKSIRGQPKAVEWYWIKSKITRFYDTLGKIEIPKDETETVEISYKKCKECGHLSKINK